MKKEFRIAAAMAAVLLFAGCAATGGKGEDAGAAKAADRGHGPQAEKLAGLMRGLSDAVKDEIPAETDEYDRWEGVFPRIADAAEMLQESAEELAGHPPGKLELPDRGRFSVLARTMADAASQLKDAAARGDADEVEIARARVAMACRDCHARYRPDAPGLPEAFR